jgi:hypothetical protein
MNGRNDAGNVHNCGDCVSFQRGSGNFAASHLRITVNVVTLTAMSA